MKNKACKKTLVYLLVISFIFQIISDFIPIMNTYATVATDSNAVHTPSNAEKETVETSSNAILATSSNADFYEWYWSGTESNEPLTISVSNKDSKELVTKRDVLHKLPFTITFIDGDDEPVKMEVKDWASDDFPEEGTYYGTYEFTPVMYEEDIFDDFDLPIATVNVVNHEVQTIIDQINRLLESESASVSASVSETCNTAMDQYSKKASMIYERYQDMPDEMKEQIYNIDELLSTASLWQERAISNSSYDQIHDVGGSTVSEDGKVVVSKTIEGTDVENIFDITLSVTTQERIEEIISEPDMAVVFVMDISYTMKNNFNGTSRYEAAMESAELFLDKFAEEADSISKVGYVAFNTNAFEIAGMQTCSTQAEADALKTLIRKETGSIINASGYSSSTTRFTNIEAGLKMGYDLLKETSNTYKYVIFLSDGLPTTYLKSGYNGYNPYTGSGTPKKDGVFYDSVAKLYCTYGTSYSDKAAIRARQMATVLKKDGINIFSVGVDVESTKISDYFPKSGAKFSVIDRASSKYEIGDANSTDSFPVWLKGDKDDTSVGIGSGYYFKSSNKQELADAYESIFEEIIRLKKEATQASWVAKDPLPTIMGSAEYVGFVGFFDENGKLTATEIKGSNTEDGENTVSFDYNEYEIHWDLKESGYKTTEETNSITFDYRLKYRVRLKTENMNFLEGEIYPTNETTTLTYHITESIDGEVVISEEKKLEFQIPSVKGNVSELEFQKIDIHGNPLMNATFSLTHDPKRCDACKINELDEVPFETRTAKSDENGIVFFNHVPSGHTLLLTETEPPEGYKKTDNIYIVKTAFDSVSVSVKDKNGNDLIWDGKIKNDPICNIVITKEIDEYRDDFGERTFLYLIEGTDFYGNPHRWTRVITVGPDEYTGTAAVTEIPASDENGYKVTELVTNRYQLNTITSGHSISGTTDIKEKTINLDLCYQRNADVTFESGLKKWHKFSHASTKENAI